MKTHFTRRRYRSWRWGFCRGVTNRIADIVYEESGGQGSRRAWRRRMISSRKRAPWNPLSIANPGSDHNAANRRADAIDFRLINAFEVRNRTIRRLGVRDVSIQDFGAYTIWHNGRQFRIQPIAGNHGTGPHFHVGVRRI